MCPVGVISGNSISLVSNGAGFDLKDHLLANPDLFGQTETRWILVDDDIDTYYKSWLDGEPYAARLSAEAGSVD